MSPAAARRDVLKSGLRGIAVLGRISAGPKRLSEISSELRLNKTTVLRILRTLVAEQVLRHDPGTGLYSTSMTAWTYLIPFQRPGRSLVEAARQELDRLTEARAATSLLLLPTVDGGKLHSLVYSLPAVSVYFDPASISETDALNATAGGKCYLAGLDEEGLRRHLEAPLERVTPRTIVSPGALRTELARVRRQGYALNLGEVMEGNSAVAVPIRGPDDAVVGAVALVYVGGDTAGEKVAEALPALRDAADRLSDMLTYSAWLTHLKKFDWSVPVLPSPWDAPDPGYGEGATPHVRTVARVVRLMMALFRRPEGMSLAELARERRLDKKTTWRLLRTLIAAQLVWRDGPEGTYRLSPLYWLGRASLISSAERASAAVDVLLQEVARATGATASLAKTDQSGRMSLSYRYALPPTPVAFHPEHTGPSPVHTTASGKCYLAAQSPLAVRRYISQGLPALTENSITSREGLLRELEQVRRHGYALNREEMLHGIAGVAVPITDASNVVLATLAIVPLIGDLTAANIGKWVPLLQDVAGRLSQVLLDVPADSQRQIIENGLT